MVQEKYIIYLKKQNVWRFTKINNSIPYRRHFYSMEAAMYFRDQYFKKETKAPTNINLRSIEQEREDRNLTKRGYNKESDRPISKKIEFYVDENGKKEIWDYYYETGKENLIPDYVLDNSVEFNRRVKRNERKIERRER